MGESWEARQAARARARLDEQRDIERRRAEREWQAVYGDAEATGRKWAASMTLGVAVTYYGRNGEVWACACVGPPYCCRFRAEQAFELQRGAHIVAKMLEAAASA